MSPDPQSMEAILLRTLDLPTSEARADYLDLVCGDDAELRRRIEELLPTDDVRARSTAAWERLPPTHFSHASPELPPTTFTRRENDPRFTAECATDRRGSEEIGTVIAERYRLLAVLGEGGMGTVFRAEQIHPLRRIVALKVIKTGIDCSRILARFDAERQALARMDHANIAKVFDAGTAASGRPYFAMEYVPGVPLTQFCDEQKLPLRSRLELFIQLCSAVQHAHQKGIIHRDLKPGNILVELVEGQFVLKVIDFGLAKAFHEPLADRSEMTLDGVILGTPLYMAPEQVRSDGQDTDTRADIYAMGAILYELLTGTTPLTRERIRRVGLPELFRLIREEEPVKPSELLRDSFDFRIVAGNRASEPDKLQKALRGDLDWIAVKALEKDRSRRYETASGFAADIRCYLEDEPIAAGPPSRTYRIKKLIRRNRGTVLAAGLIFGVLLIGVAGTTLGMLRARDEAQRAAQEARLVLDEKKNVEAQWRRAEENAALAQSLNHFLQHDLLGQADIRNQIGFGRDGGRDPNVKVRTLLDRAAKSIDGRFQNQPLTEAVIRRTIGATYRALGEYDLAQPMLEKALTLFVEHLEPDHTETITAKNLLATLYQDRGRYAEAEPLHADVLNATLARVGENHIDTLTAKINLALLYQDRGKYPRAEALYQEVLTACENHLGIEHPKTLTVKHNLATLYQSQGKYEQADRLSKEVLTERSMKLGSDHPQTLAAKQNLAMLYKNRGNYPAAEKLYREVWALSEAKLGKDHNDTLTVQHNLATLFQTQGRQVEAEAFYREVLAMREIKLGKDHADTLTTRHNLATLYQTQGRYARAEAMYREVLALCETHLGGDHAETLTVRTNLALLEKIRGRYAEAERLYREVLAVCETKLGNDHPNTLAARHNLASLYQTQGKFAEAEAIHNEVVALSEVRFGKDHPSTLTAKYNLALLYVDERRWESAERWCLDLVEGAARNGSDPSLELAGFQSQLGLVQLSLKKFAEAESVLMRSLRLREKLQPYAWTTFNTQVLLGGSLAGQRRYAEAESLLLAGYRGLKKLEGKLPAQGKIRLMFACELLVELYAGWGKTEEATRWRALLPRELAPLPHEVP